MILLPKLMISPRSSALLTTVGRRCCQKPPSLSTNTLGAAGSRQSLSQKSFSSSWSRRGVIATTSNSNDALLNSFTPAFFRGSATTTTVTTYSLQSTTILQHRQRHFFSTAASAGSSSSAAQATETNTSPPPSSVWHLLTPSTKRLAIALTAEDNNNNNNDNDNSYSEIRRYGLSKAITLCESRQLKHHDQAALLLTHLLEQEACHEFLEKRSFRVGLAGAPGAGKSTMIEALGLYILQESEKYYSNKDNANNEDDDVDSDGIWHPSSMAVVCIDPSSGTSGGSILGDKTRMTELSRNHKQAFVRPAPSGAGTLGGLSTYTNDVVSLCQSAGRYPLVLVETVGVGQSEVEVQECVDYLIVLVPPAGGDDLQGVKKGIMEVADLVVVTKADGNLEKPATRTAADYKGAMQFLHTMMEKSKGGGEALRPKVMLASSVTRKGLDKIWEKVSKARTALMQTPVAASYIDDDDDENSSGDAERQEREADVIFDDSKINKNHDTSRTTTLLMDKRQKQAKYWMWKNLQILVQERANQDPQVHQKAQALERQLESGRMTPRVAAKQLLEALYLTTPTNK